MSNSDKSTPSISLPGGFQFNQVSPSLRKLVLDTAPGLGPLAHFVGHWSGTGFNTIFRPNSAQSPTPLPVPAGGDNVLELNLTSESLAFSNPLGSVPNRGMVQGDVFLNGVTYLQTISDITIPTQPVGIHVEPGIWIVVPPTTDPTEGQTVVRMASIPHGTTIVAQGTATTINGPPTIPAVDITPFTTGNPANKISFPSQTAANQTTARIPQDLTTFIASGTITQAMLTDPNSVLRNVISHQTITSTTQISISTAPASPLFGGGTDNIAFLLGNAPATSPNAQTLQMTATFWIESVQHIIPIPIFKVGQPPLQLKPQSKLNPELLPTFSVKPPINITEPQLFKFTSTQIQYSQVVMLNFNGLTWPHVSVATLRPVPLIEIPVSAWA